MAVDLESSVDEKLQFEQMEVLQTRLQLMNKSRKREAESIDS